MGNCRRRSELHKTAEAVYAANLIAVFPRLKSWAIADAQEQPTTSVVGMRIKKHQITVSTV
jgi:hypothetical protein